MSKAFTTNRRNVLKSAAGMASVSILPSSMLFGQNTPSEQFRFAQVGCGGKGWSDMNSTIGAGSVITQNVKDGNLSLTRSTQLQSKYKRKK